ncbi:hypothetical protein Tco_0945363, partial [Tanacetum coccineum]
IGYKCGYLLKRRKVLMLPGVADALAEHKANRSRNGDDNHDSETGVRRQEPVACECTYSDFLKCQPLNFKGTEGDVGLNQWFEKIETTVSHEVAYAMTWKTLKKMMTDKYYPRGEIKKLEIKDAIEFATKLVDQKIHTLTERQAENKRKLDNNNQAQQQPPKKQSMSIAYTDGSVGHLTRDCKSPAATNNQRNLTCYECGNQGHYMSDCPELKNQNHGNQAGGTRARRMVHALGEGETNQDLNNMEDDINA